MATAAPSRFAAMANQGLSRVWQAGWLPRPAMDAATLEAAAFGTGPKPTDGAWREPYELLVQALREEADLNPLGLSMAHGQIVGALRGRQRAEALWARHPEILRRKIVAPVIVLGSMRSGTTRVQRLLACDPRFAHTRLYESLSPIPLGLKIRRPDSRALRARASLAALKLFNPDVAAIHPMKPHDPEEEFGLISFSFGAAQFEAQWRVPSFTAWWEEADTRPLYREFKALLQTIGWARGECEDKTWLLKAPQFMQDVPALLDVFPDARLVCLDRDIDRIVGSACSLVWHQMRIQSDSVDPAWIGQEWLRKTRLRQTRAAAARAARPDVPQIEIGYDAMDRDWRGEIGRLYDFLELALSPAAERRMNAYVAGARAHHGHRYTLEQFGLSPEAIRAQYVSS